VLNCDVPNCCAPSCDAPSKVIAVHEIPVTRKIFSMYAALSSSVKGKSDICNIYLNIIQYNIQTF
jgi:hypothetical protein